MVDFAPKLESGEFIPRPAPAIPSTAGVVGQGLADIASLGSMFLSAMDKKGGGEGTSEAALKRKARNTLSSSFDEASQLAAQGFKTEADNLIRNASVEYISSYGRDGEFDDIATLYQVAAPTLDFQNAEALKLQSAMEDPDFITAFAAIKNDNPDIEDGIAISVAAEKLLEMKVDDLRVRKFKKSETADWYGEGTAIYGSALRDFVSSNLGALQIKEQNGGVITPDDIIGLRTNFEILRTKLTKPDAVTDDDFSGFKGRLDSIDRLITTLEEMPEKKLAAIKTQSDLGYFKAITGTVTDPVVKRMLLGDPELVFNFMQNYDISKIQGAMKGLTDAGSVDNIGTSFKYFGDIAEAASPSTAKGKSDASLYPDEMNELYGDNVDIKTIESNFEATRLVKPEKITTGDQAYRDSAEASFAAAAKALSGAKGRIGQAGIKKFFGDGLFKSIEALDKTDPESAARVRARFIDSLGPHYTMGVAYINSVLRSSPLAGDGKSPFTFNKDSGKIEVDLEAFKGLGGKEFLALKEIIDDSYGGDATKAFNDPALKTRLSDKNLAWRSFGIDVFNEAKSAASSLSTIEDTVSRLSLNKDKSIKISSDDSTPNEVGFDRRNVDRLLESRESTTPFELAKAFTGATETEDNRVLSSFFRRFAGERINPEETSWCAAMVNSVLEATGRKGSGSLTARSLLNVGKKAETPEEGDIAVFWRESKDSWKGHVGFYAGEETKDGVEYIRVLGGNQNDSVSIGLYRKDRLLGYRRPTLKGDIKTAATSSPSTAAEMDEEKGVKAAGVNIDLTSARSLLPSREDIASILPSIPDVSDSLIPSVKATANFIGGLVSGEKDLTPISAIQMVRSVVSPSYKLSEDNFSEVEMGVLSAAAEKALSSGRKIIRYEDYGNGIAGNNVIQGTGVIGTILKSINEPENRVALTIGQARVERKSDGSIWIHDKYDFHPKDLKKFKAAMEDYDYGTAWKILASQTSGTMSLELMVSYIGNYEKAEGFSIMVKPPKDAPTDEAPRRTRPPESRPEPTTPPIPRERGSSEGGRPFLPGLAKPDLRG